MQKSNAIINEFLTSVKFELPYKLAYKHFNNTLIFLAVIKEKDKCGHESIVLTQACLNAKYSQDGYFISTTIIPDNGSFSIPENFKILTH